MQNRTQKQLDEADRLKEAGRHKEAISKCEESLAENLKCVEAFEEIGDNFLSLREFKKAEKALLAALKIDPSSANANYLLGFAHSASRSWPKALAHLEKANELRPNHPEILRCLGWAHFSGGNKKLGLILLERAHTLAPDDVPILCDLAIAHLNEKQHGKAGQMIQRALRLEPDNEQVLACARFLNDFKKKRIQRPRQKKKGEK